VAITTRTYRAARDAAVAGRAFDLSPGERTDLQQSFSRGFSHGFLDGTDHQRLVEGRFPKSRGVRIGTVVGPTARGVVVELGADRLVVRPGDGIVFDEGRPEQDEQGGRVYGVRPVGPSGGDRVELTFAGGAVNSRAISAGSLVWRTDDPRLRQRLERSYATDRIARRKAIDVRVEAEPGQALRVDASDRAGHHSCVSWPGPLERAVRHSLTVALVREQFGRLGDTPFELGEIDLVASEPVMVPKSVLNQLRRSAVLELLAARATGGGGAGRSIRLDALDLVRERIAGPPGPGAPGRPAAASRDSEMTVLARTMDQLDAILAWAPPDGLARPAMVYCDFEDVRRYRDAVERARAAGLRLGLALLRIAKPGEEGFARAAIGLDADALLVRNLSGLSLAAEIAPGRVLVGDSALNVANEITADLLARAGLARMVPSHDLDWEQLAAMLGRIDPALFEVVIHHHMPMFHMEHCVFAAFLSSGRDWRDCGRPCDRHRVDLRDRIGASLPVVADAGCRNTVFNAVAQSAAELVGRMRALGLRTFRVELLREELGQVAPLLDRYARVIAGLEDGRDTWRQLRAVSQLGVTRGTLRVLP
jgi:putative protease